MSPGKTHPRRVFGGCAGCLAGLACDAINGHGATSVDVLRDMRGTCMARVSLIQAFAKQSFSLPGVTPEGRVPARGASGGGRYRMGNSVRLGCGHKHNQGPSDERPHDEPAKRAVIRNGLTESPAAEGHAMAVQAQWPTGRPEMKRRDIQRWCHKGPVGNLLGDAQRCSRRTRDSGWTMIKNRHAPSSALHLAPPTFLQRNKQKGRETGRCFSEKFPGGRLSATKVP